MNSTTKPQSREKPSFLVAVLPALLALACGPSPTPPKAAEPSGMFVFAPQPGLVFRHQMKQFEEFAIAGTSFRESEEWRVLWEVQVAEEADRVLYNRRLVELAITVNGKALLTGNEIESRQAKITQVMSRDGRVLDVTGTDQLTAALVSVVPESERAWIAEEFSPANLRELLLARAVDAFEEVVGKPSDVGATWSATHHFGALTAKTMLVDSALGCGSKNCRKLVRTFDVDQQLVADVARARVADFVTSQGGDPAAVKVIDSNLTVEDFFVVEPETCLFHDATLSGSGRFVLEGPKGGKIELALTSKHESHSEYPVPQ